VKQIPFEWVEAVDQDVRTQIELPAEAIETVVALMAQALVAIVRAREEAGDER